MKNLRKYTIALFVCFFALIVNVSAKTVTYDKKLVINQNFTIGHASFKGMSCTSGMPSNVKVDNSSAGDGFSVIKYDTETTNGTKVKVDCTWQTTSAAGKPLSGSATYNFTLDNNPDAVMEDGILTTNFAVSIGTVAGYRNPSTGKPVTADLAAYLGGYEIVNYKVTAGSEYIKFVGSCTSSGCEITPSDYAETLGGHQTLHAKIKITVKYNGKDYDVTANVTIDMTGHTRIYPGSYTGVTCNIGSPWTQPSGKTYYETDTPVSSFPDCTSDSTEIKVVGWSATRPGLNLGESNRCTDPVSAPSANGVYYLCVETAKVVTVTFGRGTLNDPSGKWQSAGNAYAYRYSGTDTVELPSVDVEGFVGWHKGGPSGPIVDPGTTVPVDNTRYVAEIQSTRVYTDQKRTVRVGKTMALKLSGMTDCQNSTSSSKINVSYTNGECQVSGVEATEGEERIPVTIKIDGRSDDVTYNFEVVESFTTVDESNIIAVDKYYNIVWGQNYHGQDNSEEIAGTMCDHLFLSWGGKNKKEGASAYEGDPDTSFGGSVSGKYTKAQATVMSSTYKVDASHCDPGAKYWAFCLDPGLRGPDSSWDHERYNVQDKDLSNSKRLRSLITYILGRNDIDLETLLDVNNGANYNPTKIALHHSTRFAAIIDRIDAGPGVYPGHYYWYKKAADAIKACGEEYDSSTKTCIKNAIKNNFMNNSEYSSSSGKRPEMINSMTEFMYESLNVDLVDTNIGKEIENTEIKTEGTTMKNVVKGSFKIPAAATNVTFEGFTNASGITGTVNSFEAGGTEDGMTVYNFEVTLSKEVTNPSPLPSTKAEKLAASFKLKFDGATVENIFLATSANYGAQYQRMLVFNTSNAGLSIYIPFVPDCDGIVENYNNNKTEANADILVNNQCCSYVGDIEGDTILSRKCGKKCTTSTVAQVCSYSETPGLVDVYKVEEAKLENENQISACVVNVEKSKRDDGVTKEDFEYQDDNGNKYNVAKFAGDKNKYCEVTCKEDWTIVMEAYGNYVGQNAVAAGTYFRIKTNDTFMGNKTECYSSFIDYAKYTEDQSEKSKELVDSYNNYSWTSHVYTDIKKQSDTSKITHTSESGCVKRDSCVNSYGDDEYACGDDCCHMTECAEDDEDCEPEEVDDGEPDCLEMGSYHIYKLETKRYDVDSGSTDKKYKHKDDYSTDNHDNTKTTKHILEDSIGTNMKDEYQGYLEFSCTPDWAVGENGEAGDVDCSDTGSDVIDSYGGYSLENSDYCSSAATVANYCVEDDGEGKKQDAFEKLRENFMDHTDKLAAGYRNEVSSATNTIYDNADKFYACQHFQLYNNSTLPSNATNNEMFKVEYYVLGKTVDYTKIETKFEPGASYEYDDDAYMTILDKENIVEQYLEKNDDVLGADYTGSTNTRKKYEIQNVNDPAGGADPTSEEVHLSKNYLETYYYWTGRTTPQRWKTDEERAMNYHDESKMISYTEETGGTPGDSSEYEAKKGKITLCVISANTTLKESIYYDNKGDGAAHTEVIAVETDDPEWKNGSCFEVQLLYNDINYVKTSIENSSFYKNKGNWYFSNSNSLYVAHGDTRKDAYANLKALANKGASSLPAIPESDEYWTEVGLANVFPISYSAPRNLYTYTYRFGDIGYYFESGALGRIMGGNTPIIQNNSRTCFYEVYENFCICCGSDTYTYGVGTDTVKDYYNSEPMAGAPSTNNFSDLSKIQPDMGVLGVMPSTVQLADFDSDSGRELASNWGTDNFYYDGYNYEIEKGAELLDAIQDKGETIYSQESSTEYNLEYSFILKPSTIASIREFNDDNGYEISFNRVNVYGRYLNGGTEDEVKNAIGLNDADTISFVHYGSVFLESELDRSAITKSLADRGDSVCYVTSGFQASDIQSEMESGCRWVDYITDANLSALNPTTEADFTVPGKLRMALK